MLAFTELWGFVRNGRDERGMLESWRLGLPFFGLSGRWRWFRTNVIGNDHLAKFFLPAMSDKKGMGYLYAQANQEVSDRETKMTREGDTFYMERPDYLQYCVEARADSTGTALGSTLGFLLLDSRILVKARWEIESADRAKKLSDPIAYEESRQLLPYMGACIKESLRLNPPAPNLFSRVVPPTGKEIDGVQVPEDTEVATVSFIVQRDPKLYAPDPEVYRPERWLEADAQEASEMEASQFVFGVGPRVCLGKDIATMQLWKLLPQIIRTFDLMLIEPGQYVVTGGVAYNQDLKVQLTLRNGKQE
ncbi:cytochrome P450 17A1 [Seiridium cupressi]